MLDVVIMNKFKKDYKTCQKRGYDMQKINAIMSDLINEIPLPLKNREHQLLGNYKGDLECHIEPDWLLIYTIDLEDKKIYFNRTGTHSDLF